MRQGRHIVALAGNPNTGRSTVFNSLTGLRQHTGNWPGKTVVSSRGRFEHKGAGFEVVDLPGTYSLSSTSQDEEVARDFLVSGDPDVVVIVVDATCLERNLNLVLQVMAITDRVVVCLNLMDEARRAGLQIDPRRLGRELGAPVVPTVARAGEGLDALRDLMLDVATRRTGARLRPLVTAGTPLAEAVARVAAMCPDVPHREWVALRLLDGDHSVLPGGLTASVQNSVREERWALGQSHEVLVEQIYAEASRIGDACITRDGGPRRDLTAAVDRVVTSRIWGVPLMIALLALVFWLTIVGANYPSKLLAWLLLDTVHPALHTGADALGVPWWLIGITLDGMYLATAWVVSVMLPPMAIFFPLFTLLEDLGYLPRAAFNLDRTFRRCGAHGKQCLTMAMGFGCNAAGVVATRIIQSPRERLVAIVTNNFALCNGRWPTQVALATIFVGALAPAWLAGVVSAAAVVGVALLGVALTFGVSWALTRTVLRGEVSTFHLELPPYRPPRVWQTLYTSLLDRTIFVLWRAVLFALPAGAVIWIISNVEIGGTPLATTLTGWLTPVGVLIGLNGIILLAYIVAIPANEIVIPTVLMLTVGAGSMFELESATQIGDLLHAGGWTLLTAVCVMLFSLVHNPCSTTIYTIWKETHSVRWTVLSTLLPLGMGLVLCFFLAQIWRLLLP